MDGRVVSDWTEDSDETVSELVTFGGVAVSLATVEALFVTVSGVESGLAYAVIAVGLLMLVQYRPEPAASLYQSLLLIPVFRIVQTGFPPITDDVVVVLAGVYSLTLLSGVVLARTQDLTSATLGLARRDLRLVAPGLLVGIALGGLHRIVHPTAQLSDGLGGHRLGPVVAVAVLVVFAEAFLFRGLVQRWASVVLGQWVAVATASLLAAVGQLAWVAPRPFAESGLLALVLGWLYAETENLWFVVSVRSALVAVVVAGAF